MSWKIVLRRIPELCVPNFTGALLTSLENAAALPDELWPHLCEQTRNFFVQQYGEVDEKKHQSQNRQVLPDQSDETPIPVSEPVIHPEETPNDIGGNDDQNYELTVN
ncbi:unnamed protein product [Allacma fusca]|uniref:Uncharacterized protein n=1 Tax=Allacma fusca TaxID=39272 RepID=A0A8J2JWE9_9HEXA|nr:unnamed protein product [Allacma fusca]